MLSEFVLLLEHEFGESTFVGFAVFVCVTFFKFMDCVGVGETVGTVSICSKFDSCSSVAFFATEEYVREDGFVGFCSWNIFLASAMLHFFIVLIFRISFACR